MDLRQEKLTKWVAERLNQTSLSLDMVSGDASFRRYFRANVNGKTWIAMDAPPEKEDSSSFVSIALFWLEQGIQVPAIEHYDLASGFLLLSDFGDDVLLASLVTDKTKALADNASGDHYYSMAMHTLLAIQSVPSDPHYTLPAYNAALLQREMALFPDWLLEKKLGLTLSTKDRNMLTQSFQILEKSALTQPQVPVHRDYHARNLMVLKNGSLGVIDFQDAVLGPISYDLVSLLRDCYIVWPDKKVEQWCQQYYALLKIQKAVSYSYDQFKTWFDLMGLQRHLKAAGIFARLSLRDGKHSYLNDIPRTVDYLVKVSKNYENLNEFNEFLVTKIQPLIAEKLIENQTLSEELDV